ncbi:DUF4255 domain-containing protein [Deinococcus maricopensis]|uniref:DUF4255 domain-containing protein n=1 Tax=Deinococcus maricopensis TaxID=309887 RepID=UPI0002FCEADD|nr:DUF4255 domain-containing protein [Deinococcus maricopensis]
MISDVQDALKALLYREANLPADALDIRFATPTSAWVSGLTRPTVNFFLHDIRENTALRRMEHQMVLERNAAVETLAPRRMDLRYVVMVFFKSQVDEFGRNEWNVLWRVLAALMRHDTWPEGDVPANLRALDTDVLGQVAQPDANRPSEVFSGLGLTMRPHLTYTLTVPLDLAVTRHAPLVLERDMRLFQSGDDTPAVDLVRSTWQLSDVDGRPLADAMVRANTGARGFTDSRGLVHLNTPRDAVTHLQVMAADGRTLHLPVLPGGPPLLALPQDGS